MLKRGAKEVKAAPAASDLNKMDRRFCLDPKDLGEGWVHIVPDKIKLSEDRPYLYREVKGYALRDASMENRAQLLIVLFEYGSEKESKDAFKEIGKGLESEMPKNPGIGEESVVYELELMPTISMKIMSFRYGPWLAMFTLWLFKGHTEEDAWVKEMMRKQLGKVKSWRSG